MKKLELNVNYPLFLFFCSVDKKFTSHPKADSGRVLKVTHDGDVTWFTPIITTTKCVQEAYYFPLERQICNLTFGSWLYDATQVKISASFDDDAMEFVFKSDKVSSAHDQLLERKP